MSRAGLGLSVSPQTINWYLNTKPSLRKASNSAVNRGSVNAKGMLQMSRKCSKYVSESNFYAKGC